MFFHKCCQKLTLMKCQEGIKNVHCQKPAVNNHFPIWLRFYKTEVQTWGLLCFCPLDNLSVGHQCCSQGGQDSKCKDGLYRSQCCGWRRLLASASRVALWICSRRPEAYDVRLSVKYHAQVKHTYSFFSNAAKGWASPCVLSFKLGHSFKQYLQCQPCSGGPHSRGQLFVI